MKINEAIRLAVELTGQVVADEALIRWLSELDGRLAFEFYRTDSWAPYDPEEDTEAELLVPFPWDNLYVHHLAAMTYFSNGEYDRYENELVMSEKKLTDFRSFMQRTQAKFCGCGFPTDKRGGTYVTVIPENADSVWFWISAYSLAVKHGFSGTEDEWLASIKGEKGDKGDPGLDQISTNTNTSIVGVLAGNGSKITTATIDSTPTAASTNLVSSGGVKSYVDTAVTNEVLWFDGQAVSAGANEQICRVPASGTDARITADHVVSEAVWGNPASITGNVAWQTYAGYVTFTGTCTAATTVTFQLSKKGN